MKLISSKFKEGGITSFRYLCEESDLSSPLGISGWPKRAKSLTLIMDDRDVPKHLRSDGMFHREIIVSISFQTTHVPKGLHPKGVLEKTTNGYTKYVGPCPPDEEHCYFFKLSALNQNVTFSREQPKRRLKKP